eukprot:TRINITY_DN24095_c0_g1_i1.p1 TRINITY_DN24095_c0_g1~~TRINITY_DN24095_c0_g1_i1.p1  ORF type:complete len:367 (+),score=40.92 TRINITY_DN24095_c0_g1_i1:40-1140(+)
MGCTASTANGIRTIKVAGKYRFENECSICGGKGLFCMLTGERHDAPGMAVMGDNESETEKADRVYLMGVYDSKTLMHDLLTYTSHGTVFTRQNGGQLMLYLDKTQLSYDDDKNKETRELTDIESITLMGITQNSLTENNTLLRTFRVKFKETQNGKKNKVLTTDLTLEALTIQELEAWVISLSCLSSVPPSWEKYLDVSSCPYIKQLDIVERNACSAHNIPPVFYYKVKEYLIDKKKKIQVNPVHPNCAKIKGGIRPPLLRKGALLVTKGELRFWTSCDIFRTSVIWMLLQRGGVVYDDAYKWATPTVALYTLWYWSSTNHHEGPSALRSTIYTVMLCQRTPRTPVAGRLPDDLLSVIFTFLPMYP